MDKKDYGQQPDIYDIVKALPDLAHFLTVPVLKAKTTCGEWGDILTAPQTYWSPLHNLNDASVILHRLELTLELKKEVVNVLDAKDGTLVASCPILIGRKIIDPICEAIVAAGIMVRSQRLRAREKAAA